MGGEQSALSKSALNHGVINETVGVCGCDKDRKHRSIQQPDQYLNAQSNRELKQPNKDFFQTKSTFVEKRSYKVFEKGPAGQVPYLHTR